MLRDTCPACNSQAAPAFTHAEFEIWRCHACGSLFVHNVPEAEALNAIYASATYYELPAESVERIQQENQRRLQRLVRLGARGRLLDVGCARGAFLDAARRENFETFGTELSPENAALCQRNQHRVILGSAADAAQFQIKFDVISCLDVIEHVPQPREFFSQLVNLLAPGGWLVISTPNYSGLIARILQQRDPFMIPPEHLNFFTAAGMRALFEIAPVTEKRHENFGRLTAAERQRAVTKFFPRPLQKLSPLLEALLPPFFANLNFLRQGLEQEFYLQRQRP
ncbi:MAG: hypothetical protein Fur0035_12000 [Anaerolineales bacterium]